MTQRSNLICPFCGLHCDDLCLEFGGGHLARLSPACPRAEAGYRRAWAGIENAPEPALRDAAEALCRARRPLLVLGNGLEAEAVEAAFDLAQALGGRLLCDPLGAGLDLAEALGRQGALLATLGECRPAQQVVLCGRRPEELAPRIWEFLGEEKRASALECPLASPIETIRWLRLALRGEGESGPERIRDLAKSIQAAPSGVVVVRVDWLGTADGLAGQMLQWLNELNRRGRWLALFLGARGWGAGAAETLLDLSGAPGSLRGGLEGIRFAPRECRWERAAAEADAVLWVGEGLSAVDLPPARSPSRWVAALSPEKPAGAVDLWMPAAQVGLDAAGTLMRVDGVPVALEDIITSGRLSATQALRAIRQEASV